MSTRTGALRAGLATFVLFASPIAASRGAAVATSSVSHVAVPIESTQYYTGTLGSFDGHIVVGDISNTTCQLAMIQPTTLYVVSNRSDSCDDPVLYGENVIPVDSLDSRGSNFGQVRISVRDQATGSSQLGPIVMRYGNFSDTRPEWTYGGGYLWLYDVGTEGDTVQPQLPAEVLRISLSTGKVLATTRMPALSRIELAADDDGLWFAPSQETGWPVGTSPPAVLYFLAIGAIRPHVVQQQESLGQHVNWMVAAGHTAWVNATTNLKGATIVTETFNTDASKPLTVTDDAKTPAPSNIGEGPTDTPPVLYAGTYELVAALPGWLGTVGTGGAPSQQVVTLDPTTGGFSDVSTFATLTQGVVQANVVYGGALYVLVSSQVSANAMLYRVTL